MPTSKNSSPVTTEADGVPFTDSPTLVLASDGTNEVTAFSVPTEMGSVSAEDFKRSNEQKVADAPQNPFYTITHEIGTGGYGAIWFGVQAKLKRRVALKSLKAETNNKQQYEKLARLFRQEALTTAYLQHPNVVPVYDLTEDNRGQPMVAMKLVEGRQWSRVLAEDFVKYPALEFLEIHLPVLINLAQAVAFAHSKGVIHRDLKPSQVMIGSYGEVLLMDWGLAMAARDADGQIFCDPAIIIDAESPLLKPINPAGTPGYMAPEQTMKDASKLGPWTDIYLMGAILFELLTGYKPHKRGGKEDPFQEARENRISRAEVWTPERDIPAQLSTLAAKAMSTKPSQRVSSASAFATELKDYLVKASRRGESMALVTEVANSVIQQEHTYEHLQLCIEKLDRALATWTDNQMAVYLRHQVLVTFARTALANHDLKFARLQAERLHDCHERSNLLRDISAAEELFTTQEVRMNQAYSKAKGERERAETLVTFLLIDLQNELRAAGRVDLIYKVATQSLRFFDSLEDEQISEDTLYKRSIAYQQIGNVLSEQGRRTEAETAYNRALELGQVIGPKSSNWSGLEGECLVMLGKLHYSMGRLEMANRELNKALSLQKIDDSDSFSNSATVRNTARIHNDLALVHWREQDLAKARTRIEQAVITGREFYRALPADSDVQNDLATFLTTQSNIFRDRGELDKAISSAYEALTLRIALSEQYPGNATRAEGVYWVRSTLGLLQLLAGDFEEALENLKQDLPARRRIFEESSESVTRNFGITFQLSTLAEVNFLLGRLDETHRLLTECIVYSRQLAEMDESNPTAVSRHAHHLVQMSELLAAQDRWPEAKRFIEQAVEKSRFSYWLSHNNSVVLRPIAQSLAIAARLARREGKIQEAQQLLLEARDIFTRISGKRSLAEHQALTARLQLETASHPENELLLASLRANRRLDPYLHEWAKELNLID